MLKSFVGSEGMPVVGYWANCTDIGDLEALEKLIDSWRLK